MAEPQTMSRTEVLAELARVRGCLTEASAWSRPQHGDCLVRLNAIAAWLSAACVVESGHRYSLYDGLCGNCGQRRADAPEGGQ